MKPRGKGQLLEAGIRQQAPDKGEVIGGDGIALTSIAHPPGLIEAMAEAILDGRLDLAKGAPRKKPD